MIKCCFRLIFRCPSAQKPEKIPPAAPFPLQNLELLPALKTLNSIQNCKNWLRLEIMKLYETMIFLSRVTFAGAELE